jgi:hypothetical protein
MMIPSGSLTRGIDPDAFVLPAGTALRYEQPAAELQPLIPSYAVLDSDARIWKGPDSWVLPGCAQIRVKLTAGRVTVSTHKRRPALLGAAMLYGPSSRAMPVTSQGGVTVVIDLSAQGWARLIDRPADTVRDQLLPLDGIWTPERVTALIDRLHASDRATQVKPLLDDFFLPSLPPPHRDEGAIAGLDALLAQDDQLPVADVAATLGLSSDALLRLANRHFGFPTKLLMRRSRFLRTLTNIMLPDEPALAPGLVPPGYHDMPHLLRDAGEFLGLTPRRFLALPMPYLLAVMRARQMVIGSPLPALDRHPLTSDSRCDRASVSRSARR